MSSIVNYYELLEVAPTASEAVIKYAYKGLANKCKSNKNKSEVTLVMQSLNEAKDVLTNNERRKQFDKRLKASESKSSNEKFGNEKSVLDEKLKAAEKATQAVYRDAAKAMQEKKLAEQLRKEAEEYKKNVEREILKERARRAENLEQALEAKYRMKMNVHQTGKTSYSESSVTSSLVAMVVKLLFLLVMIGIFSAVVVLSLLSIEFINKGTNFEAYIVCLFFYPLFKLAKYSFGQFCKGMV